MRDYTNNTTGTAFTLWPSWGWIVAIIAAGLWFLVGICAASALSTSPLVVAHVGCRLYTQHAMLPVSACQLPATFLSSKTTAG